MCFSLVSMLDSMGQNLTPLKSRLSKLQSWHQNFSCLVGPNEHFYSRCLLSARTSHGTTFAPRLICFVSHFADEDVYRRFEKHNYVLSFIHCHGICVYIVFSLLIARLMRLAISCRRKFHGKGIK